MCSALSDHIRKITSLGALLCCFSDSSTGGPATLFQTLCITRNVPHLELTAPAWNPYLTKDINPRESVQGVALKVCLKQ